MGFNSGFKGLRSTSEYYPVLLSVRLTFRACSNLLFIVWCPDVRCWVVLTPSYFASWGRQSRHDGAHSRHVFRTGSTLFKCSLCRSGMQGLL